MISREQRGVWFLSVHDLIGITYIRIERVPKRTVRVRDLRAFREEDFLDELAAVD